jgi:gluconokinase
MGTNRRCTAPVVLALDIGTSSVRCALFDARARRILKNSASETYRLRNSREHGAELDPAILLHATRKCLRQIPRLTNDSIVAGSGFWHSLLGLDRAGKPLTPIYTWADTRSADEAVKLRAHLNEREILQRTGCMLRATFWPAKLRWLRRAQPKIFRRVTRWVSPAEWIFEEIFGVRACSHSMASGSGLYNFSTRDWDREMLEVVGLTSAKFNPLCDRAENFFSAIGDGAAGNLGSGATDPNVAAINIGTSAAVRVVRQNSLSIPFGLFRFVVDEKRALFGGAISNAGNLRAWCLRELRLSPNDRKIERILRAPKVSRLTVLPFWVSERAPTWPENLDGVVIGLTQATTAADLLRATTAAIYHRLADIFDELEKVAGHFEKIIVSGGILQSPASLQILADSLGRDFVTTADQEASLRGAAVHALEKLGEKIPAPKFGRVIRHRPAHAARAREDRQRQVELEKLLLA